MRRALAVVFTVVVLTATPALASEDAHDSTIQPATAGELIEGDGDEHGDDDDDGRDGTDPAAFAALLVAGMAAMAAVTALIFATKRAPA